MKFIHSILFGLSFFVSATASAQIGVDNTTPDASSVLDLNSTDKGLLIPRMTTAQRQAIVSPANSLLVFDTSLKMYFYYSNGQWQGLSLWSSNTTSDVYYNSGKVGVGTSTPRGTLDIDGPGDIYLSDDPNAGTSQSLYIPGHIFVAPYSGSNTSYFQARRANGTGSTAIQFRTTNNGSLTEAMHIDKDGNVGVGTVPSAKLHINGAIRGASLGGSLQITTDYGYIEIGPMGSGWSHFQTDRSKFYFNKPIYVDGSINSYTTNLSLGTAVGTNGVDRITVLGSNGNVGIGTTAPNYALDVNGPINTSGLYVNGSLLTATVPDGSITTQKLADGSVTLPKLGTDVKGQLHKAAVDPTQDTNVDFTGFTLLGTKTYSSRTINLASTVNMKPYVRMQMQGMRDAGGADYLELQLQRSINGTTWSTLKTVTYRLDDLGWTSCIVETVDTGATNGLNYYRLVANVTSGTSCNMSNFFTATIFTVIAGASN